MRPASPNRLCLGCSKLESISTVAARHKTPVYVSEQAFDEQQALSLVQRWLRIPTTPTEEELVASASSRDVYLSEPTFDISDAAVFDVQLSPDERHALGSVAWRRVTGQLYSPTARHSRLEKGCLQGNNLWFLGALAAVSCKRELLLDLISSDEHAAQGLYTFRFFKHGAWQQVVVDNRLLCVEKQQCLAFCSSGQAQELWPSLIEKAYARLHGGYAAIAAGSIGDALVDLTGGIMTKINLCEEQQMADAASGMLWSHLVQWISAGSIIACMAKQQQQQQPAMLQGILANTPYSILSATELPGGTKLLRLHCPWSPEGMWQGSWGPAAQEWQSAEAQAALAADTSLTAGLEDPSTFWCSYWDFIQVFNRCWLLQLPPSSWHQIQLSAGWIHASAGGPPTNVMCSSVQSQAFIAPGSRAASPLAATEAAADTGPASAAASGKAKSTGQQARLVPAGAPVCVSSSWCCNPQFKLVAARSSTVAICLSQKDLQVQNKGYQRKQDRDFQIGLAVMCHPHHQQHQQSWQCSATGSSGSRSHSPAATLDHSSRSASSPAKPGTAVLRSRASSSSSARRCTWSSCNSDSSRLWQPGVVVAGSGPLSAAREVVVRFQAERGQSYVLVPYTRHAGDTGPFILRIYGPSPMQLEQLPTPMSLVIGGQWASHLAGGRSCHATFGSNPQYLLSVQRETTVVLALLRPDIHNSLLPPPYKPQECIGLTLCTPELAPDGLGRRTAIRHQATEVYAESDYTAMDEAVLLVRLQPEMPYVLVPSTASPGIEVPYEMRLLSSQPIELMALPEVHTISHTSAWIPGNAGGCNLHTHWPTNPAFHLVLQHRASCRIVLNRLKGKWRRNESLSELIGFYLIKPSAAAAAASPNHRTGAALKQMQMFESSFVPCESAEAELELPSAQLLLVPCTFEPGVTGRFTLSVTATCPFTFQPADSGLAAAAAAVAATAAAEGGEPRTRSCSPKAGRATQAAVHAQ